MQGILTTGGVISERGLKHAICERCAADTGKDMTTGLLLADPSPPADGVDAAPEDGPLGELRRRLTLLQGPQVMNTL